MHMSFIDFGKTRKYTYHSMFLSVGSCLSKTCTPSDILKLSGKEPLFRHVKIFNNDCCEHIGKFKNFVGLSLDWKVFLGFSFFISLTVTDLVI